MEFPHLLDTRGDSHLFVYLTEGVLRCILVQARYDAGCSSTDELAVKLPRNFSLEHLDILLGSILKVWSEEIGWNLVVCRDDLCLLSIDEGDTVGGATLVVGKEYSGELIHSYVLGVDAVLVEDQTFIDITARFLEVSGASSLIYVVADWNEVRVLLAVHGRSGLGREGKTVVRELKMESTAIDRIVETSMGHVMTTQVRKDTLIDIVSNLREQRPISALSPQIYDTVRSLLTSSLINMRDSALETFGIEHEQCMVCATGALVSLLPVPYSSLAIIDGLQLRGTFEVCIDREGRSVPGGISYLQKRFAYPFSGMYSRRYMYISPEKGATGKTGEVAFRGRIVKGGHSREDGGAREDREDGGVGINRTEPLILGQTGQIVPISVGPKDRQYKRKGTKSEQKTVTSRQSEQSRLLIEPAKSVYFPNLEQILIEKKRMLFLDIPERVTDVVVDCRSIPVVYGPDPHANLPRVNSWLRSFPGNIKKEAEL